MAAIASAALCVCAAGDPAAGAAGAGASGGGLPPAGAAGAGASGGGLPPAATAPPAAAAAAWAGGCGCATALPVISATSDLIASIVSPTGLMILSASVCANPSRPPLNPEIRSTDCAGNNP